MILESKFKFSHLYGTCFTYLSHFPSPTVTLLLTTILHHPKLSKVQFFYTKVVLPLNVSVYPFIYYFSGQGFSVVLAALELTL